jgi:AraC-like DNA-binding protein
MKIFIKNMVCNRCITAVKKIFNDLDIVVNSVQLGEVQTLKNLDNKQIRVVDEKLQAIGFNILEDSSQRLIEKVKKSVILIINGLDVSEDFILSKHLADELHKDYSAISKTFSQHENVTLEQYFILQKIEKAKELLRYGELNLTEISGKLGYKSVQHLSAQFRNVTGFTPSHFKKLKERHRIPLDQI